MDINISVVCDQVFEPTCLIYRKIQNMENVIITINLTRNLSFVKYYLIIVLVVSKFIYWKHISIIVFMSQIS